MNHYGKTDSKGIITENFFHSGEIGMGSSSFTNLTIISALKNYLEAKELFYTCTHMRVLVYTQKFPITIQI